MKLYVLLTLFTALALGGCGDHDSSAPTGTVTMAVGTEYAVSAGDQVVPTGSVTPQISVRHRYPGGERFVTLLAGSAELQRGVTTP